MFFGCFGVGGTSVTCTTFHGIHGIDSVLRVLKHVSNLRRNARLEPLFTDMGALQANPLLLFGGFHSWLIIFCEAERP